MKREQTRSCGGQLVTVATATACAILGAEVKFSKNVLAIVAQVNTVQFEWVNNVADEISQAVLLLLLSPSNFLIVKKIKTRILQVNIIVL